MILYVEFKPSDDPAFANILKVSPDPVSVSYYGNFVLKWDTTTFGDITSVEIEYILNEVEKDTSILYDGELEIGYDSLDDLAAYIEEYLGVKYTEWKTFLDWEALTRDFEEGTDIYTYERWDDDYDLFFSQTIKAKDGQIVNHTISLEEFLQVLDSKYNINSSTHNLLQLNK